jgi:hypothetical protein
MATRRQRERKARQRAFHNAVVRNFMYHGRLRSWRGGVPDELWIGDKRQAWGPEYRQQVLGEWPAVDELSTVERDGVSYYWQTSGHVMCAPNGQTIPTHTLTRPIEL